jgi:hypothetical protein
MHQEKTSDTSLVLHVFHVKQLENHIARVSQFPDTQHRIGIHFQSIKITPEKAARKVVAVHTLCR